MKKALKLIRILPLILILLALSVGYRIFGIEDKNVDEGLFGASVANADDPAGSSTTTSGTIGTSDS